MIYAEDVFLLNAAINYIILVLTKKISKSKTAVWREIIGACLGGVYAVLMFSPIFAWAYTWVAKLVFAFLQVWIVFGMTHLKEYLKTVIVFHFTTFAMAGATYGILSISGMGDGKFPVKVLVISIVFSYACITILTANYRKKVNIEKNIGELKIKLGEKEVCLDCLADTGNEAGITIVEFSQVRYMFPIEFSKEFESENNNDLELNENALNFIEKYNLKIQPFCGVGKGGMLLCFTASGVFFNGLPIKNTIGLIKHKMSPTGMYHAITGGIS